MGFEQTSNGKKYYLHNKGTLWFFSKEKAGCVAKPDGYSVGVNKKTGLPYLKKN